jgi:CheY-like chemotaxis protein
MPSSRSSSAGERRTGSTGPDWVRNADREGGRVVVSAADWYSLDEGDVLVVGDASESPGSLVEVLKAAGYRIQLVRDMPSALRAIGREPPDLILLDVDTPGMDGHDVCRALQAEEWTRDVPVILASARGDAVDRAEGFCAGGVDYIVKPYQAEEVLARVRTHLLVRRLQQRVAAQTARLQQQGEALSRAMRRRAAFLASAGYQLRTPLSTILGISEVLRDGVYGPLNERQITEVRAIEESGRQLLDLMDDILDLSRTEDGQMSLEIGTVLVEEVCRESLALVRPLSLRKQLELSFSLDPAVTILQADERRLKQILANLLSNAVKFTPEGGAVGLQVVGDAENKTVDLTVWDTGIGIVAVELERLDEPFVQLDSRPLQQQGAPGIGMSLVRCLAESHGGRLYIQSRAGEGNRFTVSLPWQGPETEEPSSPAQTWDGASRAPAPAIGEGGPLILLAEDDRANAEVVLDYLEAKGYRVIVARDGSEAVHLAGDRVPDLILMDIQMPGTDGLEAIRRIRAEVEPTSECGLAVAETPIIALTALAMPGDQERCMQAGADAYLSKPVRLKQLVEVIAAQLRARTGWLTAGRADPAGCAAMANAEHVKGGRVHERQSVPRPGGGR